HPGADHRSGSRCRYLEFSVARIVIAPYIILRSEGGKIVGWTPERASPGPPPPDRPDFAREAGRPGPRFPADIIIESPGLAAKGSRAWFPHDNMARRGVPHQNRPRSPDFTDPRGLRGRKIRRIRRGERS